MKLLKPTWVNHDDKPVFGIDIHPDGSRFATGGQGEDSGRVIIWNMAPVRKEEDEKNENVPKILCEMDNHLACVNCVRWSNNGYYLASGADDRLVMVWQMISYGGTSRAFGSGKSNIEQWKCAHTLRSHTGDVLDLAWSPDDAWLASCSIDNSIVIWNALKFPEIISVLNGHSGLVKGVTWDPVGKYVATQSDDKSLRIWRTMDWKEETSIFKPFEECGGTTHVLRLSWSPDGAYVVSAHAMNNRGPTAQIIDRDGWKANMDFVGHRKAVTCVRFNSNIFTRQIKRGNHTKHQPYTCCAIGSRDRTVSIWLTALKRPLVVVHDIFNNSIMDLAWSSAGDELMACSVDGTVCYFQFNCEEVGKQLTNDEKVNLHEKVYGKSILSSGSANLANRIIENPEMLKLQQQQRELREKQASKLKMRATPTKPVVQTPLIEGQPLDVKSQQIETRTPDGRRRITPLYIAPQQASFGIAPKPFPSASQSVFTSPASTNQQAQPSSNVFTEGQSKVTVKTEVVDGVTSIDNSTAPISALDSRFTQKPASETKQQEKTKPPSDSQPTGQVKLASDVSQKPTSVMVEKTVPGAEGGAAAQPVVTNIAAMASAAAAAACAEAALAAASTDPTASVSTPPRGSLSVTPKRKDIALDKPVMKRARREYRTQGRIAAAAAVAAAAAAAAAANTTPSTTTATAGTAAVSDGVIRAPKPPLKIPVPSTPKNCEFIIPQPSGSNEQEVVVELENNVTVSGTTVHRLRGSRDNETVWESILTSRGILITGNSLVVCVSCENQTLNMFTCGGRRLIPACMLPSIVSILQCSSRYAMAITSLGMLYVWDLKRLKAIIRKESLLPIMKGGDVTITNSLVTEHGVPAVSLSNGRSYSYSSSMSCWMLLSQQGDCLSQCSDHHSCQPSQDALQGSGPLTTLHGQSLRAGRQSRGMFHSNHSLKLSSTMSYLENQLSAAQALKSAQEYRFWLLTYVRYLVQEEQEARLRDICSELLGPFYREDVKESLWQPMETGLSKHDLLEEILPIIGSNLKMQRLYTEYKEELKILKEKTSWLD
ncbi:protein HIRA-like [Patiria miniata]|uniref:Protein HIRA n=1 Tax=Patiria miniata TaxID=46514 RepID=A0A914A750_PATMI|nr:protein HIRA-like [Patiria miniata]